MKAVYACAVHNIEEKQKVLRDRKWKKPWKNEGRHYVILCDIRIRSASLCACVIEMTDLPF